MSYRKSGIIDTRDLQERLEELQELQSNIESAREEIEEKKGEIESLRADEPVTTEERKEWEEKISGLENELEELADKLASVEDSFGNEEQEELAELESLESEVSEWRHGAALIPEDEFVEYCQQLLEDIGDLPRGLPGYIAIDWDKTADNLRADYSEVEYQGTTYLVRS